jgi:DNA-directed RNA polymerase I and III subunit RPAC1
LRSFIENCSIEILKLDDEEIIFDLVGVEPPLANALRRIMIAEIPTMAIEKVNMWQNTSIIPDESLAHRIGLVPIKADARKFEYHKKKEDKEDSYTETDCIQFKLHI